MFDEDNCQKPNFMRVSQSDFFTKKLLENMKIGSP